MLTTCLFCMTGRMASRIYYSIGNAVLIANSLVLILIYIYNGLMPGMFMLGTISLACMYSGKLCIEATEIHKYIFRFFQLLPIEN